MAGAGYKLFQTGDVLTAAQVNTYLNEQTVMVFANAAARTSALTSVLAEGMVSYLQDTNAVEVYNGSAWVGVSGAGDVTEVQAGTGISVASGTGPIPVVTNTMATAIDAKGDLVVGTGADTFSRLAVGTNGYTLVADSSVSPTGLKWAVDPVADVVTTAGDLIYGTAADTVARLGIGTAGQVLKVNSGATAPEWGAAGAAGISYTLQNAGGTALTGAATITISGISNKEYILVMIEDASSASASSIIRLRINGDTGLKYGYQGIKNIAGATYSNTQTLNVGGAAPQASTFFPFGKMDNNAGSGVYGSALILGGTTTGIKSATVAGGGYGVGTSGQEQHAYSGIYEATAAITSISINSSTGNFDGGTVWVYCA